MRPWSETFDLLEDEAGQQERRKVIERPGHLDAVRAETAPGEQGANVVHEYIDAWQFRIESISEGANFVK